MNKRNLRAVLLIVVSLLLAACQMETSPSQTETNQSASEFMQDNDSYAAFSQALDKAGMSDLGSSAELTLFVPTTDAFQAHAEAQGLSLDELLNSPDLEKILSYHMAEGLLSAADLSGLDTITSRTGDSIRVELKDGSVILNDSAKVIVADLKAQNVIIHVIDAVLELPTDEPGKPTIVELAIATEDLSTLVAAVQAAGLVDTLSGEGPFTVFAPTNAAFEAALKALDLSAEDLFANKELLTAILTYHVLAAEFLAADVLAATSLRSLQGEDISVDAENVKVNDSNLTATDITASNGVVHIIDAVLVPPSLRPEPAPSIVDIVINNPDFSILLAAVQKADLVDALSADGPLTVFAPTNAAFEALAHTLHVEVADLLELPNLTDILLYHVAPDALDAASIAQHGSIKTLQGSAIHINVVDDEILLNHNKVISPDIRASNGIVHVIDGVLLPQ